MTSRSLGKAISSVYGDFLHRMSFKVGNEGKIRFWEDTWVGDESLADTFPSLYRLSYFKHSFISDFLGILRLSPGDFFDWNLQLIQNLNDTELPQLVGLLDSLGFVRLTSEIQDRR